MSNISKRGFGSMDPVTRAEIASKGGKAAHESGRAHEWDSESARKAGRKGAAVNAAKRAAKKKGVQ